MKNPMDAFNLPQELKQQIAKVDEMQIDELIQGVMRRYEELHPEREAMLLTLSRDSDRRGEEWENMLRSIRSVYALPKEK